MPKFAPLLQVSGESSLEESWDKFTLKSVSCKEDDDDDDEDEEEEEEEDNDE